MSDAGTLTVTLDALGDDFDRGLDAAEKRLEGFESTVESVGRAAAVAFGAGAIAVGSFIHAASDAKEQLNVIQAAFGDELTPEIIRWADITADAVGRSKQQILDFAGSTQAILSPMMGSADAAAEMSQNISQLAVDMGSFFNVADSDALQALKAGLIGESEPMKRFGVVMLESSLNAFALAQGLGKTTREMTEAEKVALRYAFIMEKTANAQGDAAKTADGFANVSKRITGQMTDLAVQFGEALLPAAEKAAGMLSNLLEIVSDLSPETKKFAAEALAASTGVAGLGAGAALVVPRVMKMGSAFSKIAPKMLGALLPIVPHILLIGAALAGAMVVVGAFADIWEKDLGGMRTSLQKAGKWITSTWSDVVGFLGESFDWWVDTVKTQIGLIVAAFEGMKSLMSGEGFGAGFQRGTDEFFAPGDADDGKGFGAKLAFAADAVWKETKVSFERGVQETFGKLGKGIREALPGIQAMGGATTKTGEAANALTKAFGDTKKGLAGGRAGGFDFGAMPDGVAEGIADSLQVNVDKALGQLPDAVDFSDPAVTATEGVGAALDDMARTISNETVRLGNDFAIQLRDGLAEFSSRVTRAAGKAGQVFGAAVSGFQSGGIWGAVVAAVIEVVMMLENTKRAMDALNKGFDGLLEAINPLLDFVGAMSDSVNNVMLPVFEQLGRIFESIGNVLEMIQGPLLSFADKIGGVLSGFLDMVASLLEAFEPIVSMLFELGSLFTGLGPTLELFGAALDWIGGVFREIGEGIREIGKALGKFWDSIRLEIHKFFSNIGLGKITRGMVKDILQRQADANVAIMEAMRDKMIDDAASAMDDVAPPISEAGKAVDRFADSVRDATGAMTNVPAGLKVARSTFEATDVDFSSARPGAVDLIEQGRRMVVENLMVVADDPADFLRQLEEMSEFERASQDGTPLGVNPFDRREAGAV
jgi:hypothetical protein